MKAFEEEERRVLKMSNEDTVAVVHRDGRRCPVEEEEVEECDGMRCTRRVARMADHMMFFTRIYKDNVASSVLVHRLRPDLAALVAELQSRGWVVCANTACEPVCARELWRIMDSKAFTESSTALMPRAERLQRITSVRKGRCHGGDQGAAEDSPRGPASGSTHYHRWCSPCCPLAWPAALHAPAWP
jgi:hypothetical protein